MKYLQYFPIYLYAKYATQMLMSVDFNVDACACRLNAALCQRLGAEPTQDQVAQCMCDLHGPLNWKPSLLLKPSFR